MSRRKYEVHATLGFDTLVVGCDDRAEAEKHAQQFKREGYTDIRVVENF